MCSYSLSPLLRGSRCSTKGRSSFKAGEAEDPERALFFLPPPFLCASSPLDCCLLLPTLSRPLGLWLLVCYLTISFPDVTAICTTSNVHCYFSILSTGECIFSFNTLVIRWFPLISRHFAHIYVTSYCSCLTDLHLSLTSCAITCYLFASLFKCMFSQAGTMFLDPVQHHAQQSVSFRWLWRCCSNAKKNTYQYNKLLSSHPYSSPWCLVKINKIKLIHPKHFQYPLSKPFIQQRNQLNPKDFVTTPLFITLVRLYEYPDGLKTCLKFTAFS